MRRTITLFLVFLLSNVILITSAFSVELDRLSQRWLPPSSTRITADAFDELLSIAKEDPLAQRIIDQATAKFRETDPRELRQHMDLCSNGFGGQFLPDTLPIDISVDEDWNPELKEAIDSALDVWERPANAPGRTFTTRHVELLTRNSGICMSPNDTVFGSFEILMHELSHFITFDLADQSDGIDVLKYATLHDFVLAALRVRGGEMSAWSLMGGIPKRLRNKLDPEHKSPISDMDEVLDPLFNDQGELIDPAGLEKVLLDPLDFGYEAILLSVYPQILKFQYEQTADEINMNNILRAELLERLEKEPSNQEFLTQYLQKVATRLDELNARRAAIQSKL